MYLDIVFICKYIAKTMCLEKLKQTKTSYSLELYEVLASEVATN